MAIKVVLVRDAQEAQDRSLRGLPVFGVGLAAVEVMQVHRVEEKKEFEVVRGYEGLIM